MTQKKERAKKKIRN